MFWIEPARPARRLYCYRQTRTRRRESGGFLLPSFPPSRRDPLLPVPSLLPFWQRGKEQKEEEGRDATGKGKNDEARGIGCCCREKTMQGGRQATDNEDKKLQLTIGRQLIPLSFSPPFLPLIASRDQSRLHRHRGHHHHYLLHLLLLFARALRRRTRTRKSRALQRQQPGMQPQQRPRHRSYPS